MKDVVEKTIVEYIDAHFEEAVALLEKTVNIESPTENLNGVRQVGKIFDQEFAALGFTNEWIEMPAEINRAGHFAAKKNGANGRRILLLGHLDTVLRGERFRRENDNAFGTGILDMKAGNVILFYALKTLIEIGAAADANFTIMLTGDEENGGKPSAISRRALLAAAADCDFALCFENGEKNLATVARRGFSDWEIEITAKTGHSSQIFGENIGEGAILEAARILNRFYETFHGEKYLSFNPAIIAGGSEIQIEDKTISAVGKSNVVPAKVFIRGDLRFISHGQKEETRVLMKKIVAENLPRTAAKITFRDGIPAMPPTAGNYDLLARLDQVSLSLDLGKIEAQNPGERGAGDISHIAHLLPCLDGLGAFGGNAHAPGEYISLQSFSNQIKRAAALIYHLTSR